MRQFLGAGTRTAKLTTVRADGRPHAAPVWFLLDGDDLVFMTLDKSVKGRNLTRDPRVCVVVDEEAPPYSFVMVEGRAEIQSPSPDELLEWATRIARRYVGRELADEYGRRNSVAGELLVRIKPVKVVAMRGVAD